MAEYAHVDCPGKVLHNMDTPELAGRFNTDWNASKLKFIGKYKFNIAFENSDSDGYMTEKSVLLPVLTHLTIKFIWQKIRLRFLKGE